MATPLPFEPAPPDAFIAHALRAFAQESQEQFSAVETAVMALEKAPGDLEHITAIFRNFHTIKGSAGLFGFELLEKFCHTVESALDDVRTGSRRFDAILASCILVCNDYIRDLLERLCEGGQPTPQDSHRAGELLTQLQGAGPPGTRAPLTACQRGMDDSRKQAGRTSLVRIEPAKLDQLIALTGEFSVAHAGAMARGLRHADPQLSELHEQLGQIARSIHQSALGMRMAPIGQTLSRLQRVVRDLGVSLGKEVSLRIVGGETEMDKTLADKIIDPLMHMVRNALDHGMGSPRERKAASKPGTGQLTITASHESGHVRILLEDDGRGIDPDVVRSKALERGLIGAQEALDDPAVLQLLFTSGFSTAKELTHLSGRGVGLDVVKSVVEGLRGSVCLTSAPGLGTRIDIRLPMTLASFEGFLFQVAASLFVLPLEQVQEVIDAPDQTHGRNGRPVDKTVRLRGGVIPLVNLQDLYRLDAGQAIRSSIIVVGVQAQRFGILVHRLLGPHSTVIKPLGPLFQRINGIAGSTVLGNGSIALILDLPALLAQCSAGSG